MKVVAKKFADPSIVVTNGVLVQDEFLTNVAVGIRANQFVMQNLLPDKLVRKDTDKILVANPAGFFKVADRRAETALPGQRAVQFDEDTYSTDEFALEAWVSDDAVRNSIDPIDPLAAQAEFLAKIMSLTEEVARISEIFAAVKAAGATHYDILGAAAKWNGGTSSAPLDDFSTAIKAVTNRTGIGPNVSSMSRDSYEAFINNSSVTEILKHTSSANITDGVPIPQIRGLRLQIADAVVNEAANLEATASYKNIQYDVNTTTQFFDTVVVAYIAPNDPLTLGHNFVSKPIIAFRGRDLEGDRRQANLVYVAKKFGPKITNVSAAHIIAKVIQ